MTPNQCIKMTKKEMAEQKLDVDKLLQKHPDNAVLKTWQALLKKWINRHDLALAEIKKDGYSPEFERFWKLYGYGGGGKSEAYGVWQQKVDDPEAVIAAVPLYLAEIKKTDTTQAHAKVWLNQMRWDAYTPSYVKKDVPKCQICKKKDYHAMISIKNKQWDSYLACIDCQKYDRMSYQEVKERINNENKRLHCKD